MFSHMTVYVYNMNRFPQFTRFKQHILLSNISEVENLRQLAMTYIYLILAPFNKQV